MPETHAVHCPLISLFPPSLPCPPPHHQHGKEKVREQQGLSFRNNGGKPKPYKSEWITSIAR